MSRAQLPPASSSFVTDQARYHTYRKFDVTAAWPDLPDPDYICRTISEGRGLTHSTASFTFLPTQSDAEGLLNMTPSFAASSGLVLGADHVFKAQYVRVTEITEDGEFTRFMGVLTDVSYSTKTQGDLKYAAIDGYTAMGVDWMLSQVHLIGGYVLGIDDTGADEARHISSFWPVLNRKGQANMSELEYAVDGGSAVKIFDYSQEGLSSQEAAFESRRWTVGRFTTYMLYQLENNIPQDGFSNAFDCYGWYRELFGQHTELDIAPGASNTLNSSTDSLMNDVHVMSSPVWDLMVQLVEGSGESSLTIRYEDESGGPEARITVIN